MNLKPRKLNTAVGIIAFIISYLFYGFINSIGFCTRPDGLPCPQQFYGFIEPGTIITALIIGIIAYVIASLGCCCCKSKDKEKAAKIKGVK